MTDDALIDSAVHSTPRPVLGELRRPSWPRTLAVNFAAGVLYLATWGQLLCKTVPQSTITVNAGEDACAGSDDGCGAGFCR